jgi:6-phosphogluconolactonase (cycloisomerase 2 family)
MVYGALRQNLGFVEGYSINPATGALTSLGSPSSAGNHTNAVAITPSGQFLYATDDVSNDVWGFSINQSTGALTSLGPTSTIGMRPYGLAIHPSGNWLYTANHT